MTDTNPYGDHSQAPDPAEKQRLWEFVQGQKIHPPEPLPQPDLSSLTKQMRFAADVLDEAISRIATEGAARVSAFAPIDLRCLANRWDYEERRAAKREAMVELLEREIYNATDALDRLAQTPFGYCELAKLLIASGWRKDESA